MKISNNVMLSFGSYAGVEVVNKLQEKNNFFSAMLGS